MQEVARFIQLFRYDLTEGEHDNFERVIINTNFIHLVEWHEDWEFVAIVCKTDHPEGRETFVEDYGDKLEARKRYHSLLTMLGANDGTAMDRERLMKTTAEEHAEMDEWFREVFQKAKASGYDPFKDCQDESDRPEDSDGEQAEVSEDESEAPAGSEGHMD